MDLKMRAELVRGYRAEMKRQSMWDREANRDNHASVQMGLYDAAPGEAPRRSGTGVNRFRGSISARARLERRYRPRVGFNRRQRTAMYGDRMRPQPLR
jgi:hypothetical protein